jgi:hypothetical protein
MNDKFPVPGTDGRFGSTPMASMSEALPVLPWFPRVRPCLYSHGFQECGTQGLLLGPLLIDLMQINPWSFRRIASEGELSL